MADEPAIFERVAAAIIGEDAAALATVIDGPDAGAKLLLDVDGTLHGTLGNPDLDRVVGRDLRGELAAGTSGVRHYGARGEARADDLRIFVETYAPPPQMLIFGAVDFTAALVRVAKILGYRVTVCDARPMFATKRRFPAADEVVVDWPHRLLAERGATLGPRDAVCVLTHDPKFDVPAVLAALETDAGYLGCMGSRRTTEDRNGRLREEGVSEAEIGRIWAPIGLDLGGRTPEETAISICAEIIARRAGKAEVRPLTMTEGDIHA